MINPSGAWKEAPMTSPALFCNVTMGSTPLALIAAIFRAAFGTAYDNAGPLKFGSACKPTVKCPSLTFAEGVGLDSFEIRLYPKVFQRTSALSTSGTQIEN